MSNIMNLKSIRNKTSRNGFDLSFKRNFTAKAGELLPVMVKEVLPGDVFNINLSTFTRTQPVNTAAFARMREYYDFFFVPYELLWTRADTVLTQMYDNPQHASSILPKDNGKLSENLPYITCEQIAMYFEKQRSLGIAIPKISKNYFGYNRADLTVKLLEYLGYGNYSDYVSADAEKNTWAKNPKMNNLNMNAFGLLAYQKIYADFYRDTQWEKSNPSSFNVDFLTGTTSMQLPIPLDSPDASFYGNFNLFDLRYCNWQKDLFHGLLPSSQYGGQDTVYTLTGPVIGTALPTQELDAHANVQLNVLMLRQYEFLQKWKEIAQTASKDYKEQVKKHWNVSVGDYASECCQYLGGITSNIDINEVVNTNLTSNFSADIAGKGTGVGRGSIRFDSQGKYGLIMCIYHCLPVLDYTTDFLEPGLTKVKATDFAIPEFDQVGMQSVPLVWLSNPSEKTAAAPYMKLGYAPRYIEYKTSFDTSVGGFKRSLNSWVMSYNNDSLFSQVGSGGTKPEPPFDESYMNYSAFKVNPNSVDPIFAVNADSTFETDQFLCSTFFDIKAVRNLDVDGLPY